jgi:DNA polymerase I
MSHELYLVDGYSVIYRGYFAFLNRPLLNPQGRNSSSVFVFFRTILQIIRERSPAYLAVAMDSRVPTFRHQRYDQYKANREKAPEDLHAQVPVIEEILAALGIASVRVDGYEADDVIATLSERCRESRRPCWILSGDKDILQLIGGNVRLLSQERGASDLTEYSREKVFESKGVYPEQIVDFLALTGDSSDNVPGVKGIGEKTAQKLLSQFGDLSRIYSKIDEVAPESLKKKLLEGKDSATLSRELVTLVKDVPGLPELEQMRLGPLRADAAIPLFEREGMKSIVTEIQGKAQEPPPAAAGKKAAEKGLAEGQAAVETAPRVTLASTVPGTYATVTSPSELELWLEKARRAGVFSLGMETDSADEMRARPLGLSLAVEPGQACYVPLRAAGVTCIPEESVRQGFARLLGDPTLTAVGPNSKFVVKVLRRWGIRQEAASFDTMVAAFLLDTEEGTISLDRVAEKRLGYRTVRHADLVEKDQTLEQQPIQKVTDHAGEEADLNLRLYRMLGPELEAEGLAPIFRDVEMPLVGVLADMELTGIRILSPELAAYGREMERALAGLEDEIYLLCGRKFNINSTKQLQEILFTWRKLTPIRKTKTGYSTDVDVLEILAAQDPVPEKILAHRKLSKLKSTYVDALPLLVNEQTGRLHTHYIQTGAATGRLASKDPNLQNIPVREVEGRRIRSAFVPAPGMRFISADYEQIELAILAFLSQDPMLLQAFKEGKDIHRQTASLIFGVPEDQVTPEHRRVGKTINFGVVYGMSSYGLSQSLKIARADADLFIRTYFQRYQGVDRFLKETIRSVEESGYVHTLFGRRRGIPTITSRNKTEKNAAERMAVNSPIQGTAADIVKMAMVNLHRRLAKERPGARILLQVHDEIILEVPEDEAADTARIVKEVMETVTSHDIPLRVQVETGESWGAFH